MDKYYTQKTSFTDESNVVISEGEKGVTTTEDMSATKSHENSFTLHVLPATVYNLHVKFVAPTMILEVSPTKFQKIIMASNETSVKCYTKPAKLEGKYIS